MIDTLTIKERRAHAGRWVALEIYTPQHTPMQRIEAEGITREDCIARLLAQGLDPSRYELRLLTRAY